MAITSPIKGPSVQKKNKKYQRKCKNLPCKLIKAPINVQAGVLSHKLNNITLHYNRKELSSYTKLFFCVIKTTFLNLISALPHFLIRTGLLNNNQGKVGLN